MDLPSEMLLHVLWRVRPATSVLAMFVVCKPWRSILLPATDEIEAIWCTLAAERFPMAAQILNHVQQPVSGRQLYRSQLKLQKAVYDEIAPPPPCRTTLRQYLFTVELNFYHYNETSLLHRAEWTGFLTAMEEEERERAEANGEFYRIASECQHNWVLWDAKPDWLPSDVHQDHVRHSVRISVTNLATVTTILLFDDRIEMDGSMEIDNVLPNACGKRLSENWNCGYNGAPRSPEYCDVAALLFEYSDSRFDPDDIPQGTGVFRFGCVRCKVTSGYDADGRVRGRVRKSYQTPGLEYCQDLRSDELLCYLEHFAPWHLG